MELRRLAAMGGLATASVYAYAWFAARRFEDLELDAADVPGALLDVGGVRVHYVEAGQGPPVVLIHGLGASTFSFRYTIPELAQHCRVVALDLKGFGFSDRRPGGEYSLSAQAGLVAAVMDALGIERAAVIGHSMGGAVAARLALQEPERVERLVLVDAATDRELGRGVRLGPLLRPFVPVIALFTYHRRWFRRLSLRSAVHDPAHLTPEVVEGYFRPSRVRGTLGAMGALMAHRRRDEPAAYERIAAPTLLLWGEHDRWIPLSRGEELAKRIQNARLVVVRGAGHMPLEEQPEVSNGALLDFLGATASGARSPASALPQPAR